ncbi:MAG: SLOG family protein [Clostridia bacterium]|nr:SLOG family protein [Clostridia bacterium]
MNIKDKTCCFTGHRDISPYEYDLVFKNVKDEITHLVDKGVIYFGTGGALGFDTIAAQAVLEVREVRPEIKLILVLPCENQTKYWKQQDIDVYNDIKANADKVKILSPYYYNGCMQKRNRHLVDCSSTCICFLTKNEGGTAYTVDYAKEKGVKVINIANNP